MRGHPTVVLESRQAFRTAEAPKELTTSSERSKKAVVATLLAYGRRDSCPNYTRNRADAAFARGNDNAFLFSERDDWACRGGAGEAVGTTFKGSHA
jgi:hypothetical protein